MKRVLVLATTLAAGLLTLPPGSVQAAPTDALTWTTCPPPVVTDHPHLQCATLRVPLDYSKPNGEQLELTVSRARATDPAKRRGVLFVNPGGPGNTAVDWAGILTKPAADGRTRLPKRVVEAYDVIGLDPRGVGRSSPISCVDPTFFKGPKPDPDPEANRKVWWDLVDGYARSCGQRNGDKLRHFGTDSVAKDLDQVRIALGEEKISLAMHSYGTYLATSFATLFPHRTDRLLLDSVVAATSRGMWYEAGVGQVEPSSTRLHRMTEWWAKYPGVFGLGEFPWETKGHWQTVLRELRQAPRGEAGPNEFLNLTLARTYSESGWEAFGRAIGEWTLRDNEAPLVAMMKPGTSVGTENFFAAYNAVQCRDSSWPWRKDDWEREPKAQQSNHFAAWANQWYNAACREWPVPAEFPIKPTGTGIGPVLLFNAKEDPATPLKNAQELQKLLPGSVLVTEAGGKHGVFGNPLASSNPDAQSIGETYLLDGTLPGKTEIPEHPLPVPTGTNSTTPALPLPFPVLD